MFNRQKLTMITAYSLYLVVMSVLTILTLLPIVLLNMYREISNPKRVLLSIKNTIKEFLILFSYAKFKREIEWNNSIRQKMGKVVKG